MKNELTKEQAEQAAYTLINSDGTLQSLLYDLDLMPEQLEKNTPQWRQMMLIIAHWDIRFSQQEKSK